MKLINKAENIIEIKKDITDLNNQYKTYKCKMIYIFNLMVKSKQAVKKYQVVYWNHKELKDSLDYKFSYIAILDLYKELKKTYKYYCDLLNFTKKQIKEQQRMISNINMEI